MHDADPSDPRAGKADRPDSTADPSIDASGGDTTGVDPSGVDETLQRLHAYWRGHGCAVLPPCTLDVPMALMHPQTVFRLLDDEPWRAVCTQPVARPGDARGGRHPFRTSRHLQLQVVLKAPPLPAVRGWLLGSLEALGVRSAEHEIRLVDQRQQVDALEADGVGWRVLVDGLAVGRLTVWSRLAGRALDPPPVDLVYGIERLVLPVADVDDVYRLRWSQGVAAPSYLRLRRRAEEEFGRYVGEVASIDWLRQTLDGLAAEAARCLDAGLLRPAYERAIEGLVHLDVLERRGALTPRERAERLATIRRLVVAVAESMDRRAGVAPAGAGGAVPRDPVAEVPVDEVPVAEEPVAEEPEDPAAEDPLAEELPIDEPAPADDPVVDRRPVEEAVTEDAPADPPSRRKRKKPSGSRGRRRRKAADDA